MKTVADLRRIAREQGVKVPAGTNKALLVQLILEKQAELAVKAQQAPSQASPEQQSPSQAAPAQQTTAPAQQSGSPVGETDAPRKRRGRPPGSRNSTHKASGQLSAETSTPQGTMAERLDASAGGADTASDANSGRGTATMTSGQPAPAVNAADGGDTGTPISAQAGDASKSGPVTAPTPDTGISEPAQAADSVSVDSTNTVITTGRQQDTGEDDAQYTAQNEHDGYQRPLSTQQRMGARTQPNQGAGFRQQNRPQAGGQRYGTNDNRNRSSRGFETNANYRRGPNDQGGFRRNPQGTAPQQGYRRNQADDSSQQAYRRSQQDDVPQQGYRGNQRDDTSQQGYRRNQQDDLSQQGYYRRPASEDGNIQPGSYRRNLTEDEFQQQTGYRRPLQAELTQNQADTPHVAVEQPPSYDERAANPAVSDMLSSGELGEGAGILEIHSDGYGFLRAENYLPGNHDVYVSAAQIRRFNLRTGDHVSGKTRPQQAGDRSVGLMYVNEVNGQAPELARNRRPFDSLIPVFPDERLRMERRDVQDMSLRLIDMIAPIGKGQRGMIVSPPKAGKTTLLKKIANAITENSPDVHLIVLLIDERPEEVTDMRRSTSGEVVYSTFDEAPENHTRVSEMVLERAQRLVELGQDVVILLDSITRLARAYNLVIPPTGRSLSGGLDPGALYRPKRFFGAARNIEHGGSLTIIATALVDTGSRMDDIIYEEFKGTGNMELHLDRSLSDRRIFPAIDLTRSGTRREELLLTAQELDGMYQVRRMLSKGNTQETTEQLISLIEKTRTNEEFFQKFKGWMNAYEKEGFKM